MTSVTDLLGLTDQVALVTGVGNGIARATAHGWPIPAVTSPSSIVTLTPRSGRRAIAIKTDIAVDRAG